MPNTSTSPGGDYARFGRFALFPSARRLEKDGIQISLGGRALDILNILVDRAGQIIGHNELFERVWPNLQVDPSGLRVQMTALRKALADGDDSGQYIINIAGRGYCFVAPVVWTLREQYALVADRKAAIPKLVPLIGRDEVVRNVITRLVETRFVSIAGPGGVGKTAVAVAVAHALLSAFEGEIYFIDLSEITSNLAALVTIGRIVLKRFVLAEGALQGIADALESRRVLLVLDCCDHTSAAMREFVSTIMNGTKNCHILTTSREGLLQDAKAITALSPLEYPPSEMDLPSDQLSSYAGVRLLSNLVMRSSKDFHASRDDLRAMARMARQLDGLPLALELAAASIANGGIDSTESMINNNLGLFLTNPHAGVPRHQSLTATLEWSYDQLTPDQRVVFRNLSVFSGPFSLDAVEKVAATPDMDQGAASAGAMALLAKSMIYRELDSETSRYRMLDTTRAFALSKLLTFGEGEVVKRRHARYFADYLSTANAAIRGLTIWRPADGLTANIHNIRSALQWCFSLYGDADLGAVIAAESSHLFSFLLFHAEGVEWLTKALSTLRHDLAGTRLELDIRVGILSNATRDPNHMHLVAAQLPAITHLADKWGSDVWRVEARAWDCMLMAQSRHIDETVDCALEARRLALSKDDFRNKLLADWILGFAFHLRGNLREVGPLCASASQLLLAGENIYFSACQSVAQVCAVGSLARTLWLQGRPAAALTTARAALGQSPGIRDQQNFAVFFLPLLIWVGAWAEAREYIVQAEATVSAKEFTMALIYVWKGQLELRCGNYELAVSLLQEAYAKFPPVGDPGYIVTDLAEALALAGRYAEAKQAIDLAFVSNEKIGETFFLPETFRVMGIVMALASASECTSAEKWFMRAADCARRQGSLSFTLRATTSLARFYMDAGRWGEARAILAPVYESFTEGFDTPDLIQACALLARIDQVHPQLLSRSCAS